MGKWIWIAAVLWSMCGQFAFAADGARYRKGPLKKVARASLCAAAFGGVSLAGALGLFLLFYGSDEERKFPTFTAEVPRTPEPPVGSLAESPFFSENRLATFEVLNDEGKPPSITLFKVISIPLVGLVLEVDNEKPDAVSLRLVGDAIQFEVDQKISRARLEAGEPITLVLEPIVVEKAGQKGTATGKLVLQYDIATNTILLHEATGAVLAETLLGNAADSGSIHDATGVPGPLDLSEKPVRSRQDAE
jgi:hypothetical protein